MKQFVQNEEAVSPVIGVILMVAITVILAAVIAAFVFGMTGNMSTTKTVSLGVKETGSDLQVTVQGGSDLPSLVYLKANIGNGDQYTVYGSQTFASTGSYTVAGDITVGEVFTYSSYTSGSRVLIIGHFTDGSDQILFDKTI